MTSTVCDRQAEISPVLVLGASGRLGRMMQAFWPGPERLKCQSRGALPGYRQVDPLQEPERLRDLARGAGAVICLAGITPAQAQRSGDALSLNVDLALAAVRAASEAGAARVFLASSAAVYGDADGPLEEGMVCNPLSAYGQAKLQMEERAIAQADAVGQAVTVLRIGNVAGADAILGGWRAGMKIDTFPDGSTPVRSYIGPQTWARVMSVLCGTADLPKVLNIAAPGVVSMGALLDAAGLVWATRPATAQTVARVAFSTKRLETYARFAPETDTPAGLVAQWRAFQALDG